MLHACSERNKTLRETLANSVSVDSKDYQTTKRLDRWDEHVVSHCLVSCHRFLCDEPQL